MYVRVCVFMHVCVHVCVYMCVWGCVGRWRCRRVCVCNVCQLLMLFVYLSVCVTDQVEHDHEAYHRTLFGGG